MTLNHCTTCNQMTNHNGGNCLKCRRLTLEEQVEKFKKEFEGNSMLGICGTRDTKTYREWLRQALLIAEKRGLEEARKQVKCRYDIDGTACDCCQGNHDRIDDLI